MKHIFLITSCLFTILISCKSTNQSSQSTVEVKEEVKPEVNDESNTNEIEEAKSFEIKMDSKVPVQSISIDTTKVRGANQARPK